MVEGYKTKVILILWTISEHWQFEIKLNAFYKETEKQILSLYGYAKHLGQPKQLRKRTRKLED